MGAAGKQVIVLDRSQRILLVGARTVELDAAPAEVLWWYTPGGGLDSGESLRGQTERERLEDQPFYWWSLAEIAASEETFAPPDLARLLPAVLAGPWSGPPVIVDVQPFVQYG